MQTEAPMTFIEVAQSDAIAASYRLTRVLERRIFRTEDMHQIVANMEVLCQNVPVLVIGVENE